MDCPYQKKTGMSRAEFINYYENKHEPLIRRLLPPLPLYRRNYLVFDDPMLQIDGRGGDAEYAGYDVMTEGVFDRREDAVAFMKAFAQPEVFAQISADEANFVEPGHAKMFIVEVHQSRIP